MKPFLTALFILAFFSFGYAQNPVTDERPQAQIYVIDPQSGQETPATSDLSILFKNALLDLVKETRRSQIILQGAVPQTQGRVFTVTQFGAETNINGFQVSLDYQTNDPNQPANVYTFAYHLDDNTLYFYDPASQQWRLQKIGPANALNMQRTATYAHQFSQELANQPAGGISINASFDLNAPVDADVTVDNAPPAMPEYEQPECPSDGYLWQPGYWAYSPYRSDYYWVPGAWVSPPNAGVLWTPPYWGYEGSRYVFHVGYWGDHVGFYGGINYGYGYGGRGYYGGEWRGGRFNYNTAVVRVNTTVVHNTYINKTVINNVTINNNHSSFNGGRGGVDVKPTAEEISASREHHLKPTPEQNSNQLSARGNPDQFNKTNAGGKPVFANPKAIPFHPQNNGGLKGADGANGMGRNNMKQPITPVVPQGSATGLGKQPGEPANNTKPDAKPANVVRQPGGQLSNPVKTDPQAAKTNPQPAATVKPGGQLSTPVKTEPQSNGSVKPQTPPRPQAHPVNAGKAPAQQPAGLKVKPQQPAQPAKQPAQPTKQ